MQGHRRWWLPGTCSRCSTRLHSCVSSVVISTATMSARGKQPPWAVWVKVGDTWYPQDLGVSICAFSRCSWQNRVPPSDRPPQGMPAPPAAHVPFPLVPIVTITSLAPPLHCLPRRTAPASQPPPLHTAAGVIFDMALRWCHPVLEPSPGFLCISSKISMPLFPSPPFHSAPATASALLCATSSAFPPQGLCTPVLLNGMLFPWVLAWLTPSQSRHCRPDCPPWPSPASPATPHISCLHFFPGRWHCLTSMFAYSFFFVSFTRK